MATRTLRTIAVAGLTVALLSYANPSHGDIVDQVLQTLPPPAGTMPPPPTASVAPSPPPTPIAPPSMTPPPPTAISPPPRPVAPAPASASFVTGGGDIISQTQQTPLPAHPPAFVPWAGFYIGANLGYGTTQGGSGVACTNSVTGTSSGCVGVSNSGFSTSGILGGGQAGYMRSLNLGWSMPVMLGGELDLQGTGISGTQSNGGPFPFVGFPAFTCSPCSYNASQQISWLSTVRARLGVVPVDGVLVYGTGGVAIGGVNATQSLAFPAGAGYVANTSGDLAGPTFGGGVEVLLPGGLPLSAKLEALYYHLGTLKSTTASESGFAGNFTETKTFGFHGTVVRLGVNFHLGDIGGF